ncbi:unnamed protein product [Cladocopium goreaui]|uniref:RING-type E3 ubiquitin transferase n=1 Tax=Cladocopium goreaui TaxID=2562237 RepID=A0A9P1CCJ0_9DINO|nr:unnamed protein product [Cladocopium goreaui]
MRVNNLLAYVTMRRPQSNLRRPARRPSPCFRLVFPTPSSGRRAWSCFWRWSFTTARRRKSPCEFHMIEVSRWRDTALEEVDDDARERAKEQAQRRRLEEDKKHNKGRFGDAMMPLSLGELLASQGMVLVPEDDSRPGMSRDARAELRVKTVLEEDICVVCQETMPAGSKAKAMPCGHLFHDDCLISWVKKSNSCPTCRFDELPSEKKHFDDVQQQVEQRQPGASGLYS